MVFFIIREKRTPSGAERGLEGNGKENIEMLLYLMAVVGVLIWLDSTVGLTEEGALIIFSIALLVYFVMKLSPFWQRDAE